MRLIARIAALTVLSVSAASISPAAQASTQPGWRLTNVIRPCGRAPSGLYSVSAVSATDAWALGSVLATHCHEFLEHWNGRTWRSMRIPAELSADLNAPPVAASSASDVWAFGDIVRSGVVGDVAYAERFNGKRWHTARLPGSPRWVGATSADDMSAVGPTVKSAAAPLRKQTLIAMHWDGSGWRSFVLPRLSLPPGAIGIGGHLVAVRSRCRRTRIPCSTWRRTAGAR